MFRRGVAKSDWMRSSRECSIIGSQYSEQIPYIFNKDPSYGNNVSETYKDTPSDRILLAKHKYRCRYNKKSKDLKCPKCNSHFFSRSSLSRHTNEKVCEVGNYECEKCNEIFSNRAKLSYHNKWMTCLLRTTYKEYAL